MLANEKERMAAMQFVQHNCPLFQFSQDPKFPSSCPLVVTQTIMIGEDTDYCHGNKAANDQE